MHAAVSEQGLACFDWARREFHGARWPQQGRPNLKGALWVSSFMPCPFHRIFLTPALQILVLQGLTTNQRRTCAWRGVPLNTAFKWQPPRRGNTVRQNVIQSQGHAWPRGQAQGKQAKMCWRSPARGATTAPALHTLSWWHHALGGCGGASRRPAPEQASRPRRRCGTRRLGRPPLHAVEQRRAAGGVLPDAAKAPKALLFALGACRCARLGPRNCLGGHAYRRGPLVGRPCVF